MQGLEERADAIEPHVGTGTWVKVGLRRERFWCKVQRVRSDGALVTSVENNLQLSTLRCGDEIVLSRRNVLEVVDDSDRLLYEVVCAVLGDRRDAALQWHEVRAALGLSPPVTEGAVVGDDAVLEERTAF